MKEMYRLNIRTDNQKFMELVSEHRKHGYPSKSEMVVDSVLKQYRLSDDEMVRQQVVEYLEEYAQAKLEEYFSSDKFKRWVELLLEERIALKGESPFR